MSCTCCWVPGSLREQSEAAGGGDHTFTQGWRHRHYWQGPLSSTECHGKSFKASYNPWPPIIQVKDCKGAEKREAEVFNCLDASLRNIEYSFIKQIPVWGTSFIDSLGAQAQWVHVTFQQSFSVKFPQKFALIFPLSVPWPSSGKRGGVWNRSAAPVSCSLIWNQSLWLTPGTAALGEIPEEKGRVSSRDAPWLQERRGEGIFPYPMFCHCSLPWLMSYPILGTPRSG